MRVNIEAYKQAIRNTPVLLQHNVEWEITDKGNVVAYTDTIEQAREIMSAFPSCKVKCIKYEGYGS